MSIGKRSAAWGFAVVIGAGVVAAQQEGKPGVARQNGKAAVAQHDGNAAEHERKAEQEGKPGAAQSAGGAVSCPITGEPANLAISTATPEGPVFFCCPHCAAKYEAEPGQYAEKAAAQRQALAGRPKAQVLCPACRQAADRKIGMESGGQTILFCSEACMNTYKGEPGQYAANLANSYTYQTQCPVMDEAINPKSFATLANGARVYFCCKGCDKKLFADPAKYAPKLAEQGVTFAAKDLKKASADQPAKGHEGHDH